MDLKERLSGEVAFAETVKRRLEMNLHEAMLKRVEFSEKIAKTRAPTALAIYISDLTYWTGKWEGLNTALNLMED